MPSFVAAQTTRLPTQDARLSAPARLVAAQTVPQPAHTFGLSLDPTWDVALAQTVPVVGQHRVRMHLSPLPAEPRPEGMPATPRL